MPVPILSFDACPHSVPFAHSASMPVPILAPRSGVPVLFPLLPCLRSASGPSSPVPFRQLIDHDWNIGLMRSNDNCRLTPVCGVGGK